jgi:hypothetical protein
LYFLNLPFSQLWEGNFVIFLYQPFFFTKKGYFIFGISSMSALFLPSRGGRIKPWQMRVVRKSPETAKFTETANDRI